MECVAGILTHSQWQDFISPLSHTILVTISVVSIARHNLREKLSWLVDVCACIFLLLGTYACQYILNVGVWPHDCQDALNSTLNSEYSIISDYFRFSVASWVCIVIIDAKSIYYILSQSFWKPRCPKSFKDVVKTFVFVMLGSASVILWLCFSVDVRKTFGYLTSEWLLISYHIAAAFLKVTSVFLQRVYLISYMTTHSPFSLHIPDIGLWSRKFMCRMAIVNVVEVFHVLELMWFSGGQSIAGFYRVVLLAVEIIFKLYICSWYFRNSCLYMRCRQPLVRRLCVVARTRLCQTMVTCLAIAWNRSVAFFLLVLDRTIQLTQMLLISLLWVVARIFRLIIRQRRDRKHAPPITPGNDELVIINTIGQGNVRGELVTLHRRPEHGQEEAGPQLSGPYDEMVMDGIPAPLVGPRETLVVGVVGWHQLHDVYRRQVAQGQSHTVDIALINTKRLFVPRLEDHCHLYPPLPTPVTFPAPCVQETQRRVTTKMVVGGQR